MVHDGKHNFVVSKRERMHKHHKPWHSTNATEPLLIVAKGVLGLPFQFLANGVGGGGPLLR